jgi:hypothetical protein
VNLTIWCLNLQISDECCALRNLRTSGNIPFIKMSRTAGEARHYPLTLQQRRSPSTCKKTESLWPPRPAQLSRRIRWNMTSRAAQARRVLRGD